MNQYVIIAAGGSGSRMQNELPKQFLLLKDIPILVHAVKQFIKALPEIHIIIVAPEAYLDYTQKLLRKFGIENNIQIVVGGETRFHSVQNGINLIPDEASIVFVHDAARCLVSESLILQCYEAALEKGNAVPAIEVVDSLRTVTPKGNKILDRTKVRVIQTPQTFNASLLKKAFSVRYESNFTDEASVVEQMGIAIHLIKGEYNNIKVTTPFDLKIAELML